MVNYIKIFPGQGTNGRDSGIVIVPIVLGPGQVASSRDDDEDDIAI